MTSRQFEISLEDLKECASDTAKPKLTEVKEKYEELLGIANDAVVVTMEMRHRAGRLYSELSGVAETLLILDNISYFDYTQIMGALTFVCVNMTDKQNMERLNLDANRLMDLFTVQAREYLLTAILSLTATCLSVGARSMK